MRSTIKSIVLAGGTVKFPFKTKMSDWMAEAEIGETQFGLYVNDPNSGIEKFDNIDKAIDFYISRVFNKKNMGLAINGIHKYKMTNKNLDDLTDVEMRKLIKEYFNIYYEKDYGEIK